MEAIEHFEAKFTLFNFLISFNLHSYLRIYLSNRVV